MTTFRTLTLACVATLAATGMMGCDPEKMAGETPADEKPAVAEKPEVPTPSSLPPLKDAPTDGDEVAVLETEKGTIVLMFYPERAPKHVENFKNLVKSGFYDGTRFHRCIPEFMIQGGDPTSKDMKRSTEWGTGGNVVDGKEQTVDAEFNDINHVRGILSMARSNDPNSASSQFFIMHGANSGLNGQYTAFGKAVRGMDVVDKIVVQPLKDEMGGTVFPEYAVVLKKATIKTWPID
jgi:peptidyl-prolyl cis-trans isomerase B (cyclophilin B)